MNKTKCSDYRPCKQCAISRITCVEAKCAKPSAKAQTNKHDSAYRASQKEDEALRVQHMPSRSKSVNRVHPRNSASLESPVLLLSCPTDSFATAHHERITSSDRFDTARQFSIGQMSPWSSITQDPPALNTNPSQLHVSSDLIHERSQLQSSSLLAPALIIATQSMSMSIALNAPSTASPILPPVAEILRSSGLQNRAPTCPALPPRLPRLLVVLDSISSTQTLAFTPPLAGRF